jgi:hypothetical protein
MIIMTDLLKNCIICVSGIALIGCFITINKIEQNHKIYLKNIILEIKLSKLEEQNNQLVNKIDSLEEEIVTIKNLLGDKKYIMVKQNELLEKINNSLNSNIKLEDNYTEDKSIGPENTTKDNIEESGIFNSDDENDCYNSIPMSNVKKVTGIKSWFYS